MPYNLAIHNNNTAGIAGFLSIPQQSAQSWITQLLGETEPSESEQLSDLELSLLTEIADALVNALSNSHPGLNCQPVEGSLSRSVPVQLDDCMEMSRIMFEISNVKQEKKSQACFVLLSSCLDAVAGKQNTAENQNDGQNYKKIITQCLKNQQVSLFANFAKIKLTIEDVMNLQTDDVILLDKKIGQPIELIIEGKKIFHAQPVQCEDSYGVTITKVLNNNINI
jgi:flagellar motor switch protein FliM